MNWKIFSTETCLLCGTPQRGDQLYHGLCRDCRAEIQQEPGPFRFTVEDVDITAARAFTGITRDCIALWKTGGYQRVGALLTEALLEPLTSSILENAGMATPILIPVPALRKNRRRRGFDQALAIARHLATSAGWDVATPLRRHGWVAQKTLDRAHRQENVHSAFSINPEQAEQLRLMHRPLVLVDDVLTTGATAQRCAELLGPCSNMPVSVVVIATKM